MAIEPAKPLMTQAAASMQIKRLEEIARARLLMRSSRGTELTSRGHTLFLCARKMVTLEGAMLDDVLAQ